MSNVYFGFAISDSMFQGNISLTRAVLTPEAAKKIIGGGVEVCLNPSHAATIAAMKEKYEIEVEIPSSPPRVSLEKGDSLLIMAVSGLPRLTDRHEYTAEEVTKAVFTFALWEVKE